MTEAEWSGDHVRGCWVIDQLLGRSEARRHSPPALSVGASLAAALSRMALQREQRIVRNHSCGSSVSAVAPVRVFTKSG